MNEDQDAHRIALDSDAALLYWTCRLNVSIEDLEEAVDMVGDSVDAVLAYLNIGR